MIKNKEWLKMELEKEMYHAELHGAFNSGLSPNVLYDDIVKLIDQIDEPEEIFIPVMVSDYIDKQAGKNTLGNIAEEIYNNSTSWSRLTALQRWLRLNFTLFAKAWISGEYTIEQPKLLTVIVKDYDKTIKTIKLPEDKVNKMMEGLA